MSKKVSSNTLSFADIFGKTRSRKEIMTVIDKCSLQDEWASFSADDQESILCFLEGRQGLQILSDKFFRHVFRPDDHPERIASLISAVLGEPVTVVQVLSREGTAITESGSQVIMDIIVKTSTGSIVTVEMQRIGYYFPGERSGCYTSDMIMRQYGKVKAEKGEGFSYKDMKPVTLIVLMEKSSSEFSVVAPNYIHRKQANYSSGAKVTELDNVIYISLDTFRKRRHNVIRAELDAWLVFFTAEKPGDIMKLVKARPDFISLYRDIAEYRKKPEEVIGMFSEALRIMDRNTTKYMIDDMKRQYDEAVAERDEAEAKRDEAVAKRDKAVAERDKAETERDEAEAKRDKAVAERDKALSRVAELEAMIKANGLKV